MVEREVQRRLAAILAADVAGYTRLMEEDSEGTVPNVRFRLNPRTLSKIWRCCFGYLTLKNASSRALFSACSSNHARDGLAFIRKRI